MSDQKVKSKPSGKLVKFIKARPIYIWLVEYNDPFSDVEKSEATKVKKGIQSNLNSWFTKVANHPDAKSFQPKEYKNVKILWSDLLDVNLIKDIDLIIYFSAYGKDYVIEVYKKEAGKLDDKEFREAVLETKKDPIARGKTFIFTRDESRLPVLCEVYVLYQSDISHKKSRMELNIEKLSKAAFHEAAHNKSLLGDEMHNLEGILTKIYQDQKLTESNIAFVAQHIWNWSPQYIKGQPLKELSPH